MLDCLQYCKKYWIIFWILVLEKGKANVCSEYQCCIAVDVMVNNPNKTKIYLPASVAIKYPMFLKLSLVLKELQVILVLAPFSVIKRETSFCNFHPFYKSRKNVSVMKKHLWELISGEEKIWYTWSLCVYPQGFQMSTQIIFLKQLVGNYVSIQWNVLDSFYKAYVDVLQKILNCNKRIVTLPSNCKWYGVCGGTSFH